MWNQEIMEEIVNAHWIAFTNQDAKQESEYEVAKKKADGYFLTSNEEEDDGEEKQERVENLGLDIITLTKKLWGENSTEFVVGLMVTITTESQLEALLQHLLTQYIKQTRENK
jgi:hypothetical protein